MPCTSLVPQSFWSKYSVPGNEIAQVLNSKRILIKKEEALYKPVYYCLVLMTFAIGSELSFHSYTMGPASTYTWVTCMYRVETCSAFSYSLTHSRDFVACSSSCWRSLALQQRWQKIILPSSQLLQLFSLNWPPQGCYRSRTMVS